MATRLFQIQSDPGEHVSYFQRAQQLSFQRDQAQQQMEINQRKMALEEERSVANIENMRYLQGIRMESEQYLLNKRKSDFEKATKLAEKASASEAKFPDLMRRTTDLQNRANYMSEDSSFDFTRFNNDYANLASELAEYSDVSASVRQLSQNLNRYYDDVASIEASRIQKDYTYKKIRERADYEAQEKKAQEIEDYNNAMSYADELEAQGLLEEARQVKAGATASRYNYARPTASAYETEAVPYTQEELDSIRQQALEATGSEAEANRAVYNAEQRRMKTGATVSTRPASTTVVFTPEQLDAIEQSLIERDIPEEEARRIRIAQEMKQSGMSGTISTAPRKKTGTGLFGKYDLEGNEGDIISAEMSIKKNILSAIGVYPDDPMNAKGSTKNIDPDALDVIAQQIYEYETRTGSDFSVENWLKQKNINLEGWGESKDKKLLIQYVNRIRHRVDALKAEQPQQQRQPQTPSVAPIPVGNEQSAVEQGNKDSLLAEIQSQ